MPTAAPLRAGLTLLEVIIAAAIMSIIMGVVTQSLITGTATSRSVEATNDLGGRTARAVQSIANRLRSCDYNKIYLGNTSWTGTSGGTTLCSFKICTGLDASGPSYGQVYRVTYDRAAGTLTGTLQDATTLATIGTEALATDIAPGGFTITDVTDASQVDDNRVRIDLTCFVRDGAAPPVTCVQCGRSLGAAHTATCPEGAAVVAPWVVAGRTITNAWARKTSTIVFLRSTLFAGLNLTGGASSITAGGTGGAGSTPTTTTTTTPTTTPTTTTTTPPTTTTTTTTPPTTTTTTTTPTTTTQTPAVDNTPFITGSKTSTTKGNQIANGTVGMPLGATQTLDTASFSVTAGSAVTLKKVNGPSPTSWSVTGTINYSAPASERYIDVNIRTTAGTAASTCRIVF